MVRVVVWLSLYSCSPLSSGISQVFSILYINILLFAFADASVHSHLSSPVLCINGSFLLVPVA